MKTSILCILLLIICFSIFAYDYSHLVPRIVTVDESTMVKIRNSIAPDDTTPHYSAVQRAIWASELDEAAPPLRGFDDDDHNWANDIATFLGFYPTMAHHPASIPYLPLPAHDDDPNDGANNCFHTYPGMDSNMDKRTLTMQSTLKQMR